MKFKTRSAKNKKMIVAFGTLLLLGAGIHPEKYGRLLMRVHKLAHKVVAVENRVLRHHPITRHQ
jgi:hypothetical protein